MNHLQGKTAIVTGGSRGYGRGMVEALASAGMRVIAVARDRDTLATLSREVSGAVEGIAADVTSEVSASQIIQRERPTVLVLNAGSVPIMRPTRLQTWETFAINWDVDVKGVFVWAREALLLPLEPGSTICIISSTAAESDSPEISGYASAKAALWRLSQCLAAEARSIDQNLHVRCLLPVLTSETDMGRAAIGNFARSAGVTYEQMSDRFGAGRPLTPAMIGSALIGILTDWSSSDEVGFRITAEGFEPMSATGRVGDKQPVQAG